MQIIFLSSISYITFLFIQMEIEEQVTKKNRFSYDYNNNDTILK